MPGVDIFHRVEVGFSDQVCSSIKESVRHFGVANFSVENLILLSEQDFSFKFYSPEKGDELTNDIIVRIRLHAFEERLLRISDETCGELAHYIAADLFKFYPGREIIVGIELMMAEVMWGTASTEPRRRPGRAQISGEAFFED